MASELTAAELNKALEGVPEEALYKHMTFEDIYPVIPVFNREGEWEKAAIHPELAARIQEASMTRWLGVRGASLHAWDGLWKVRMLRVTVPIVKQDSEMQYTWTPAYAHPIEALAQACRAVKGGGARVTHPQSTYTRSASSAKHDGGT